MPLPVKTSLPPLGAHVSVAGGLSAAFPRADALGCTAIQIFVKNGSQWRGRELTDDEAESFRAAHAASGVGPLLAHASYLINLAATDPVILEKSREALADELARCARLGVEGLVVHPGAHLGAGCDAGLERVAQSLDLVLDLALDQVLDRVQASPARVLLENTAGQGSCLGDRLEHLERIRSLVSRPERVGVCLDTCHAFAAGYAIHEPAGSDDFWAEACARFGEALGALHLNDSLRPFGSRRDRHAHVGEGEIGVGAFARLLGDPRLARVPMVIEIDPGDEMELHRKDLEVLRGLLPGAARSAPPARSGRGRRKQEIPSARG
jgi:deoxyribonuclease-4